MSEFAVTVKCHECGALFDVPCTSEDFAPVIARAREYGQITFKVKSMCPICNFVGTYTQVYRDDVHKA